MNRRVNSHQAPSTTTKTKWVRHNKLLCECGQPATRWRMGANICERCYQLEKAGFTGGPTCTTCGVSPMPGFHRLRGKPPGELVSLEEIDGRYVAQTSKGTFMRQGQRWQKVQANGKAAHE